MALDAKADEMIDEIRDAFAGAIRQAVAGLPACQALQLADHLCGVQLEVLAGLRVSYRAAPKLDAEALSEDWARGLGVTEIVRKYGCSRATVYRVIKPLGLGASDRR